MRLAREQAGARMQVSPIVDALVLSELTLAWVLWIVLAAMTLDSARRSWPRSASLAAVGGALAALALRLAAPAAPHDINPRMSDVFTRWNEQTWFYTHGLVALMRVVWATGVTVDDHTIFAVVALAGAISVPLVYAVTRQLGGGRTAGVAAAVVLGGIGLHVRYSHTDAPQIVEIMLTLVAVVVAVQRREAPRARDIALVGLSLGLAIAMRPEGVALPFLLVAWAALCGFTWPPRRLLAAAAIAFAIGLPDLAGVVWFSGGPTARGAGLTYGHGLWTYGLRHLATWNTLFVPTVLGALTLAAVVGRAGPRRALVTIALLVAVGSLVGNQYWSIACIPSWCLARHELRVLPWTAVLVGLGAEGLVDRLAVRASEAARRILDALTVGGVLVATAITLPDAYAPFTISDEYAFIRAHLDEVPEGCTIVSLALDGDRGLLLPKGLPFLRRTHEWMDIRGADPDASCVVYYRSALCTSVGPDEPATDRCAAFESSHSLSPIAEAEITARGWLWEHYDTPTLRVGYYRLNRPTTGAATP